MARVIRRSRWIWLRWGIFLLIAGSVLALCFVLYELDAIIHRRTSEVLQERFIAANVTVASAHLVKEEGIELSRFFLLADYTPEKSTNSTSHTQLFPPVIQSERVMLQCPSRLDELATAKEIPIENIIFDTATIHTYRRPDGSWSLSALKTNPNSVSNLPAPTIQFRNTSIVLHDMTDTQTERKLVLRNVEMTIDTAQKTMRNSQDHPVLNADGTEKELIYLPFRGTAESEFCSSISFYGKFYPKEGEILVEVDLAGLQYSEDFRNSIPMEIAERFRELRYIRGQIDAHVKVAAPLNDFNAAQFRLDGKMTDGRSTDPRFPKLISSLATDFQITNDGYHFPNFSLRFGDGQLNLNVLQRGYGPTATKRIRSQIREIALSEAFFSILPAKLQKFLRELSPTGQFDMDAEFLFDGLYWNLSGDILCSDLSVTYAKFPYRLDQLNGKIQLRGSQVQYHFQSQDQRVRIDGNFTSSSKQHPQSPTGSVQIQAQRIAVDEQLLSACPYESSEFLRSLEIGGSVNITADYQFDLNPENPLTDSEITVQLLKNSCRYRAFPYPLRNMEGTIFIDNRTISASKIRGFNNAAEVNLSFHATLPNTLVSPTPMEKNKEFHGLIKPDNLAVFQTPDITSQAEDLTFQHLHNTPNFQNISPSQVKPVEWEIQIQGTNVTLDEELYANLPDEVNKVFRYIQPYGTVNVRYAYSSPTTTQTTPRHQSLHVETTNNGIRVSLPAMNYWLDHFQGSFQYQNGQFSLTDFSAVHDSTRFSGKAAGRIQSVNQWSFHFDRLTIDGVRFDRDLMGALPETARILIAAKRPAGALYYNGLLDLHYDNRSPKPFSLDWQGELGIAGGAMSFSFPITAINGGAQIHGHWDQNEFYCGGELNIDSLFQQNIQFTQIHGPLWVDNQQLLLGGDADRFMQAKLGKITTYLKKETSAQADTRPATARSLSARFIGGDIYSTVAVQFGYPSTFQSHIVLTNGHLENCAYLTGNDQLKGKMFGSLTLTGTDSSMHTLRGKGEFHLADADIYKLSVMMSLLKILSLKEVNNTGFSSSDMKFRIEGNHIYFDQIDFYGDAFSLIGKGEMDFKSQIKLVFYSVMGRNEHRIPIISPLLHATGRQMLLITMKGPLQNPEISQRPLPALNMALEQMESDLAPPPVLPRNSRPGLTP